MIGGGSPWRHVAVAACVVWPTAATWFGVVGDDRPERFDAKQVVVRPEGDDGLRIREVVDIDFGSADRHGYERIIENDFGVPSDVVVGSPDAPDQFTVSVRTAETAIRVGDPDRTINGQHRYVVEYTLGNAGLSSGELALDVIGNDEEVETGRFEVVVVGLDLSGPLCAVGRADAEGGCTLERDGSVYRAVVAPLAPGDGITVGGTVAGRVEVVDVAVPPLPDRHGDGRTARAAGVAALGAVGAGGAYLLARRRGRNEVWAGGAATAGFGPGRRRHRWAAPSGSPVAGPTPPLGAVAGGATEYVADGAMDELTTVEFAPPDGLEPWEGAVLLRERIDDEVVAAWFAGLVGHGFVDITSDGGTTTLVPGPERAGADPATAAVLAPLFAGRDQVRLGTYDAAFTAAWAAARARQEAAVAARGWWKRRIASGPSRRRGGGGIVGTVRRVGFLVPVAAYALFNADDLATGLPELPAGFDSPWVAYGAGAALPLASAAVAYRRLLPARTAAGSALALRTASFRRFLVDSEGRQVQWAWERGLLREYSAWAVALDAAEAWGDAIARSVVPATELAPMRDLSRRGLVASMARSRTAPARATGGGSRSMGSRSSYRGARRSGGRVGRGGGGGRSRSW